MRHESREKGLLAEWGALARQATPIAASQGGFALMGFIDTAVAGRADAQVLGAVGLGNAIFFAVSAFGLGLMGGMDPLMSQSVGAKQLSRTRALLVQGGWLAAVASAILIAAVCLSSLFVGLLDVEPGVLAGTRDYLLLRAPSLLPVLLFLNFRSYLQSFGQTGMLVTAMVLANLANLGLDVLLIFGGAGLPAWTGVLQAIPAMGPAGAAIATTGSSLVSCLVLLWAVRRVRVEGAAPSLRPDWGEVSRAAKVGTPIGLHMGAEIGVFALAGVLAARLGAMEMAAHQIALTFGSLSFCVAIGIGNAGAVRVGWAVGANDSRKARTRGFVALAGGTVFMTCTALLFFIAPELLARVMTDDPLVLGVAIPLMAVAAAFQISDGLQGVGAGVLRGAGDTRFTFWANIVGHYALGLPVALLLAEGLGWGIVGIWWGLCVGLTAVALALVWRFHRLSAAGVRPMELVQAPGIKEPA